MKPHKPYIVFVYSDYRKEIGIKIIASFDDKDKAVEFAKTYSKHGPASAPEYVFAYDAAFDAEFIREPDEEEFAEKLRQEGTEPEKLTPEEFEALHIRECAACKEKIDRITKDWQLDSFFWYIRIAVAQTAI